MRVADIKATERLLSPEIADAAPATHRNPVVMQAGQSLIHGFGIKPIFIGHHLVHPDLHLCRGQCLRRLINYP
jgi:hypothetical protein